MAAFFRAHRREAVFLLSSFSIFTGLMLFYSTYGEWCTGPRYHLFVLVPMALPILTALSEIKSRKCRLGLAAVVIAVTVPFIFLQTQMNSRPFFSRHWLIGFVTVAAG